MIAITKDYLADIIFRLINKTIEVRRASKKNDLSHENYPVATDAEILDFIHSIPFFDLRLKEFIVGNLQEETIIISQAWETEFIKRSRAWAESSDWLSGNDRQSVTPLLDTQTSPTIYLTLPY